MATRHMPAGSVVLQPACISEGLNLASATEYCECCKRRLDEEEMGDATCLVCGAVAFCEECGESPDPSTGGDEEAPSCWDVHKKNECRALNKFMMMSELETDALSEDAARAFSSTTPQLLRLLLRWTLRSGLLAYPGSHPQHLTGDEDGPSTTGGPAFGDPFLSQAWRGASPELLLTHESLREEADRSAVHRTASFIFSLASSEGTPYHDLSAIAEMLLLCRVNAHGILDPLTQRSIGVGLYPSAALAFNHSCCPNLDFLPGEDGRMRFVTTREVRPGEELTITYTDLLTSTRSERRQSLAEEYYFDCDCPRCGDTEYDALLLAGDNDPGIERVRFLHTKAEQAESPEAALHIFSQALDFASNSHRLHYKSADGVLLHAQITGDHRATLKAATFLLDFHTNFERDLDATAAAAAAMTATATAAADDDAAPPVPPTCAPSPPSPADITAATPWTLRPSLPTGKIGLLLAWARALVLLGKLKPVHRDQLKVVTDCLQPFEVHTAGFEDWLASGEREDISVHEIFAS